MFRRSIIWIIALLVLCFNGCNTTEKEKSDKSESTNQELATTKKETKPIILFFGNSITAGYGLDVEQAYPAIIQDWLDSLGYDYKVVNAGLSGETTAGGVNRIEWVLRTVPDVFVLELGGNDGLRGLDLTETEKNLMIIIEKVREVNPQVKILLAGMEVPPNLGKEYTTQFQQIYPEVAAAKQVNLLPFILEGVGGNPDLNLPDRIHPTAEGHRIVAGNVWEELEPMLDKKTNL